MAYSIFTATNYLDALDKLIAFITNPNDVTNAVPGVGNTGNGDMTNEAAVDAAPTEVWTLTATSSSNFTVSGTVSGGKPDATVGVAYNNSVVSFTITAGGTPFVSGDYFTFSVTKVMGTQKWSILNYNTNYDGSGNVRVYLKGFGTDGNDEIFVGIQTAHNDATPYYIWVFNGYTGYSGSETFFTQMGARTGGDTYVPRILLDDQSLKCWFVANGRRICGVIRVGTIYASFYLGRMLDYGYPTTYPYPLVIAGSSAYSGTASDYQWSSISYHHRGLPNPYSQGYLDRTSCMVLNGTWVSFGNYSNEYESSGLEDNCIWPGIYSDYGGPTGYANEIFWYGDPTPDGAHPLFPLILCQDDPDNNILGELQGMYHIHGDGVVSEDDLSYGGKTHKAFQNTYHTAPHEYLALLLE